MGHEFDQPAEGGGGGQRKEANCFISRLHIWITHTARTQPEYKIQLGPGNFFADCREEWFLSPEVHACTDTNL